MQERKHRTSRHVNPLGKFERMAALNPYVITERRKRLRAEVTRKDPKALLPKKLKKQDVKKAKARRRKEKKKITDFFFVSGAKEGRACQEERRPRGQVAIFQVWTAVAQDLK